MLTSLPEPRSLTASACAKTSHNYQLLPGALNRGGAIDDQEGPLTPEELRLMGLNRKIVKENGKCEPPDVTPEYMRTLIAAARASNPKRRDQTNLNNLERIARKHNQHLSEGVSF